MVGLATYNKPIPLWRNSTSTPTLANFNTHFRFVFNKVKFNGSGDGLTFFMAPFDLKPPENITVQWCGLLEYFSRQIVVVKFDTFKNHSQVEIYINSFDSKSRFSARHANLNNGRVWDAWLDYDGVAQKLQNS
ncbi:hypothetical protein SUGI_1177580 [Cryptomeria japonica]|nr:hypothetical protein SUGI_1177580 [Cryptomeria japonica]